MAQSTRKRRADEASEQPASNVSVRISGMTKLFEPPVENVLADVVFVHGPQGHPLETSRYKTATRPSSQPFSASKFLRLSNAKVPVEEPSRNSGYWPMDLLPSDLQNTRILTYGYDSKVTQAFAAPTSQNHIHRHGKSFLQALGRWRKGCQNRPIIFVAHSLGGLVVKQALIEAKKHVDSVQLLDVYESSYAVVFFGTPHRGSKLASWGLILSAVAEAFQMDAQKAVLRDLDPESGSSKLEELSLDFDDILRD